MNVLKPAGDSEVRLLVKRRDAAEYIPGRQRVGVREYVPGTRVPR